MTESDKKIYDDVVVITLRKKVRKILGFTEKAFRSVHFISLEMILVGTFRRCYTVELIYKGNKVNLTITSFDYDYIARFIKLLNQ